MALSRTAWVAAGLALRLLMLAVLAMSLQSRFSNKTHYDFKGAGYNNELHSYTYAVVAATVGMAGGLLQIPVEAYLLCKSKRMTPSALILDASAYADIVVTVVLASGVGAGFGATGDVLEYMDHAGGSRWNDDATRDLKRYFQTSPSSSSSSAWSCPCAPPSSPSGSGPGRATITTTSDRPTSPMIDRGICECEKHYC